LSATTSAYQLGTLNDVAGAKCIAWLPVPELEGFLAVGHATGRVQLTSVLSSCDSCVFNGREYTSRHNRACNTLAWGAVEPYTLAAGFDKHRSENGLTVWDVKRTGSDASKPVVEAAFGDTVCFI